MGKLIIHIGPPKTATTSLQYYWQSLNIKGFRYLGTNQPRVNNTLCSQISKYLSETRTDYEKEHNFTKKIEQIVSENKITVISEEMFVVERVNISIKDKLTKLFRIVKNENTIITFSVRNASYIYFSYYVEIYNNLPPKLQENFEEFQRSSYCDCFKYEKFIRILFSVGFKKIHFFDFKKLINGQLTLNEICGTKNPKWNVVISLPKKNITAHKNSNFTVQKHNRLRSLILRMTPQFIRNFGFGAYFIHLQGDSVKSELKKLEILDETKNIYYSDLTYLKSLEKNCG